MATVTSPSHIGRVHGKLGDLIYKWYGDRMVVTRVPRPSTKKPTKMQQAGRNRFALASRYAERARKDPEVWALYAEAAKKRRVPVRAMAIHDYLTLPRITGVMLNLFAGRVGAPMIVMGGDRHPFKTTGVTVTVEDPNGRRWESGPAERDGAKNWSYTATRAYEPEQALTIVITAKDRLGKSATLRFSGTAGRGKAVAV
jgi:hypothetical protein